MDCATRGAFGAISRAMCSISTKQKTHVRVFFDRTPSLMSVVSMCSEAMSPLERNRTEMLRNSF